MQRAARLFVFLSLLPIVALASEQRDGDVYIRALRQAELFHRVMMNEKPASDAGIPETAKPLLRTQGTGSISGRVFDLTPEALKTAWVEAFCADVPSDHAGFAKGISLVDSLGNYRITDLTEGSYYVIAWADGYELLYYRDTTDPVLAERVAVRTGSETSGIDFHMRRMEEGKSSISGTVLENGSNKPIAGAIINAFSPFTGGFGSAETDQRGEFTLKGLKAGVYYLAAWAESYLPQYYNHKSSFMDADAVAVGDSVVLKGFTFHLQRGGSISGRVMNTEGNPIGEAYLAAIPVDQNDPEQEPTFGKAITNRDGYYRIEGLRGGDYYVMLQVQSRWSWVMIWYNQKESQEEADRVRVVLGQDTGGINFIAPYQEASGSLSGIVRDTDGNPIIGAYISVHSADPNQWIYAYAVTDEKGCYVVEELPDGRYYVSAGVQNGWQYVHRWWPDAERFEDAQPMEISSGTPATADFVLPLIIGRSSIAGRVTDTSGRPLAGASLSIMPAEGDKPDGVINSVWAWGMTDQEGTYRVQQLPAGRYHVYCSYWEDLNFGDQWWNHKKTQETADVLKLGDEEQREGIDFTLTVKPVFGAVVGSVIDSVSGRPIERALVNVIANPLGDEKPSIAASRCIYWRRMWAITDAEGRFAVDWLYEGDYLVSVYADGAFEYYENAPVAGLAKPVQIIGGQKSEVTFKVTPRKDGKGTISGRVLMEGPRTPFEIAVVTARPAVTIQIWPQSEMFYTAVTDTNGNFVLKGLPENVDFMLYAFAMWTVGEYYDNVYDPEEATMVRAGYPNPTVIKDIELPVYRWMWNGPEDGGGKNAIVAQVVGRVTDSEGSPIAGARIVAFNEARQPVMDALTDSRGYYELGGLAFGNYILQAGRPGYKSVYNNNAYSFDQAKPITLSGNTVQVDFVLTIKTGVTGDEKAKLPKEIELLGNYPNPFNPETVIAFQLPSRARVTLAVYNLAGRKVTTLLNDSADAGRHEVKWNGRDDAGASVGSGVYIYRLESNGIVKSGKMVLIR